MDSIPVVGVGSEIANQPTVDQNGSLSMLGMQIKISDIIGDKLVDQFMATITPEQMESITRILFNEVFENKIDQHWDDNEKKYININTTVFKTKNPSKSSFGWQKDEDTTIYARAKDTIKKKYANIVENKVKEYLDSEEYKKKAEETAKEIIDYALEGYKNDMIDILRKRLVETPLTPPSNSESYIREIVFDELMKMKTSNNMSY